MMIAVNAVALIVMMLICSWQVGWWLGDLHGIVLDWLDKRRKRNGFGESNAEA